MDNLSYFKIITFGHWYEDKEIAAKYLCVEIRGLWDQIPDVNFANKMYLVPYMFPENSAFSMNSSLSIPSCIFSLVTKW